MSQDVKTKAIKQVMTSIKNKKQKQSDQKKDAVTTVMNSIRNKDAVYRTLDKITPEETARKRLSTIYRVAERNPEAASKMYGEYNALKRNKTSRFYDPYTEATHSSVKYLKDRGYDVDNIDDNWFKKNSWYQDNLTLNDYTNSVKKPGKKASDKEKDAYEIYQLKKAYENTKAAKKEQEDLRKYLTETATAKDRTMRDDEIIAGINWKKYPTLKKAREYAANGAPMAFTEGVGSATEDWAYGVLWAAMNNGGTGNSDADIANSYNQTGNTWARQKYQQQKKKEQTRKALDALTAAGMQPETRAAFSGKNPAQFIGKQREYAAKQILANGVMNGWGTAEPQGKQEQFDWASYRAYKEANRQPEPEKAEKAERSALQEEMLANGMTPKGYAEEEQRESTGPRVSNLDLFKKWQKQQAAGRRIGQYDDGDDPTLMSDEGLREATIRWGQEVYEADEQIREIEKLKQERSSWYPEGAIESWDNLYSELENGSFTDGENLIDYLGMSTNASRESVKARAKEFYTDKYQYLRPADDERQQATNREILFDSVFGGNAGSGAYELLTESMPDDEKELLDERLDEILMNMQNPYEDDTYYDDQILQLENQKRESRALQERAAEEAKTRAAIMQLEKNAPELDESQLPTQRNYATDGKTQGQMLFNMLTGPQGEDDVDKAYWEIRRQQSAWNGMTSAEKAAMLDRIGGGSGTVNEGLAESLADTANAYGQYYSFMTPDQVKVFESYYSNGDKDSARAYLQALSPYLKAARNVHVEEHVRENAEGKYGALYGLTTILEKPQTGIMGSVGTVLAAAGNKEAGDKNSEFYIGENSVNAIRQERSEEWGETAGNLLGEWAKEPAKFINNVLYSIADNLMAMGIASGGGMAENVSQPLVQLIMSSEAASTTMNEQLKEGRDPEEAAMYAIGSGVIEAVTEKYSLEALLNPNVKEMLGDKRQIAKFILKNFLAEGSEEGASDVLEIGMDWMLSMLNGHETELQKRYNELVAGGMSKDKATQTVFEEKMREIGIDMLAGGVSGLLMSGGRVGANAAQEKATGKTVKSAKTSGSRGQDVLVEAGLGMKEDTQSHKLAKKIQEKIESGKDASDYDVGRLASNIQVETNENIGNAARTVVEDRAYGKLNDGELNGIDRREAARIIAKAVTGEEMTASERRTLTGNTSVFNLYKQFMTPGETGDEVMGAIMDATQKDMETASSVSELLNQRKAQATNEAEDPGEQLASEEDIRNASGEAVTGARGVIVDGQWAKLGNLVEVKEKDAEGNTKTSLRWQISGTDQTVKASQIRATDFSTAAIIRQATVNPGMFSNGFVNTLMQANENGQIKNVGRFLLDAQKVRMAGYLGMQMPANTMGSKAAQDIYNQAKYEHGKNRDAQLKDGNAGRRGKITFMGAEYGTTEWNQAIKNANLDSNQRAQIDAIAGIAQRAGIEVYFRSAEEVAKEWGTSDPEMTYGWESNTDEHGRGISINIEGLDFALGENGTPEVRGQHNMLVTFGHEMTHWLQRNSANGYNQLESFVMGEMRRNGVNIQRRVMDVMERRGLSIEDAMSEIVADSCDQILANEEVRDHIQETNQGLFKEIKHFVSDLVGRVKAAIKGMDQSASRDARAMMRSANRLAKVWLGAYDEAISGAIREENTSNPEITKMSMAYLDDGTAYVEIDTDQDLFDGVDPKKYPGIVEKYISKRFRGDPITSRDNTTVTRSTAKKYASPRGRIDSVEYQTKARASTELDNLYEASVFMDHEEDQGKHPEAVGGWDYYETLMHISGRWFRGTINIMNRESSRVFYDMNNVRDITGSSPAFGRIGANNVSKKNISQQRENSNTRLSMAQLDDEYTQAVKSGDVERQQELVDQAADKNGYTMEVYHGTPTGGFTQFKDWSYFTENKSYADRYNHPSASSIRGYAVQETKPMTYALRMNPGRVFDTRKAKERNLFNKARMEYGMSELQDSGVPDWTDGRDLIEYIEENNLPYDTIILDEGGDGGYGEEVVKRGFSYVTRSNMIKSAEPVTYDDQGKVIPLSERFSKESNDIRFSMAEPVEQVRDLIAVHNLTAQNLLGTLAEGGFTAPSIAVVKAKEGHSKFGTISVIFRKNVIDPLTNRKNKIYGTDAWTPTRSNAQLETEWDYEGLGKVKDRVLDAMKGTEEYYRNEAERWIGQKQYEGATTKQFDDLALEAYGNYGMLAAYLAEKGEEIEKKYRHDKNHSELREESIPDYNRFLDALEDEGRLDEFMNDMKHESIYENMDKWGSFYAENGNEQAKKVYENVLKDEGKRSISARVLGSRLRQFYMFQQDGRKIKTHKEIDRFLMYQAMTEKADRNDFNKWLYNTLKGSIGRTGVYNGVDPYDSYGNERSWEQTHWKPTAENIVKAMYKNHEAKGGEAGGATGLMAKASKEYATIEEVRADRGRLQQIDEEEYKAKVSELDEKIIDFVNRAEETSGWSTDTLRSSLIEAGGEYAKAGESAVRKYFRQEKLNLTEEQIREAISLMDEAREIETGYFEAKPERVVGLDEIYKVIVPEDETEVIDELEKHGIPYETTDGTDEDRLRVLNEQDEARFSKYTNDSMDVEEWMSKAKPWNLVTEDERELLDKYNGLRTRRGLLTKTVIELKADIKRKESILDKLTPDELKDLERAKIKLEEKQQKLLETEDELFRVTSAEGYAGMMYRNNVVLNDFILGKTQDDVREAVEQMVDQVKATERLIASQVKALRKLADSQEVKAVSSMVEKKSLNYAVTSLKKQLNSDMGKTELESRLIEMALKKANGEDIQEDARLLAIDLTNQMRGYQLDVMERMRGVTITIGPDQQAEMKGKGMTLDDVRERLKGTGIKVEYGDRSSLDTDTQDGGDLRTLLPEMPQDIGENSADALFKFISWAQSMWDGDLEAKQSMVDIEEETTNVLAIASAIKVNLNNQEYRKQNEAAARTRQAADDLEQAGKSMTEQTDLSGRRAVGFASVLQRDVHKAIEYYNKVAKVAAQEEKNKVRKNLIEELKSENTRKLVEQQQKYEEMMRKDRKARDIAADNSSLRNRINTAASRINKRLTAETDLKNIPEEAKPLALTALKMLVQHDFIGYRHVLFLDKAHRTATMSALDSIERRDGKIDYDKDLEWLVIGSGDTADTTMKDRAMECLQEIESGLLEYRTAEGQGIVSLMDRKEALKKIDNAIADIWNMVHHRAEAEINHKRMLVEEIALQAQDDMQHSRFKGENTGIIGHGTKAVKSAVFYGNMTPEYFFKMLRNKTLSQLYDEYHRAENKYGMLAEKTTQRIQEIAEKYGYSEWDPKKTFTFKLAKGGEVELTIGEIMSLCATWEREAMNQAEINGPEKSFHLEVGGFVTEAKEKHKINGKEFFNQRPHRVTKEDIMAMRGVLTDKQVDYMEEMVRYITKEIGELGNEASMRMYGIKKFKEKFYFPMKVWSGVLAKKSDAGSAPKQENRVAHNSSSKRRTANANNALLIRDFTKVICEHAETQLRYNTFAPAIEFMNRVMNQQMRVETGDPEGYTKRTLEAAFQEVYGEEAGKYYRRFQEDINGGVNRSNANIYDKLLSTFKKSAVAGSLSVALQQPLSYIRAAMMIDPKYLVASVGWNPAAIKRTAEEMRKYSGVAVIKKIGKFDMNYGRSTIDYMTPEEKKGKVKAGYEWLGDKTTAMPELMDTWTWCNMWNAVKKEQAAQNPGMDTKSDEFLEKVAERFNDVMRKTQVYDSVLVKSQNMRSQDKIVKAFTSFMSEPTLTLNVLADAFGEVKAGDKGGKAKFAKAATTFMMSAIMQAVVKGLVGAGRSPQDKKTYPENFLYRFTSNLINEINPVSLIPGYSDVMTLLKEGEISDDALGVIGKMIEAVRTGRHWITGESENPWYRDLEDSIGVITQLFTNVPVKNIFRDGRAIANYIISPWAKRETSASVLKYQTLDLFYNANNMIGVINKWADKDGWTTNNEGYYKKIYAADRAGKQQKVSEMIEYLTLARKTKKETINEALRGLAKKDRDLSSEEKLKKQQEYGLKDGSSWIRDEYKAGHLDRKTAEKLYREAHPKMTDKQIRESFDKIDEQRKAGK